MSRLPEPIRPLHLVDGATHVRGLRGWLGLVRRWPGLRAQLVRSPGYVAHRVVLMSPTTFRLLSWWEDERSLYRFAHAGAHREVWEWAQREGTTRGGWLAMYALQGGGALWGSGTPLYDTFGDFAPGATGAARPPPRRRHVDA
jgi:heme-degrading monooxygenase HmoA